MPFFPPGGDPNALTGLTGDVDAAGPGVATATLDATILDDIADANDNATLALTEIAALPAVAHTGSASDLSTGTLPDARLSNTAVTPGSYTSTNLTVDAHGRITAAANGSSGGITALTGDVTASGSGSVAATLAAGSASVLNSGTLAAARLPGLTGDVTAASGSNATTLANIPTATPAAGSILATAIAAPSTPAAGKGSIYVDSTSKNLAVKDDAGVVKHGVQTAAAVSNQFVTAINDAGAVSQAQPAFSNLSGSVASTQMPALTGDVTMTAGTTSTTLAAGSASNLNSGTLAAARLPTVEAMAGVVSGMGAAYYTAAISGLGTSSGNALIPANSGYYFVAHRLQCLTVTRTGTATGNLIFSIGNDVNENNLVPAVTLAASTFNTAAAPGNFVGNATNQTATTAQATTGYTLKVTTALTGASALTFRIVIFGCWVPV